MALQMSSEDCCNATPVAKSVPETNSDEELSKWSGQLNFGREGSLHGEWFVRRQQQSGTETGELEVVVRLEFNETAKSGSSPWTIPKSEVAFFVSYMQEAETNSNLLKQ